MLLIETYIETYIETFNVIFEGCTSALAQASLTSISHIQLLPATTPNQLRDMRHLHVFHDTEYPLTVFSQTDSGAVLVADTNFDVLLNKLKTIFSKKSSKIESRGLRFEWNDFLIKVGIVSIGPSGKGMM